MHLDFVGARENTERFVFRKPRDEHINATDCRVIEALPLEKAAGVGDLLAAETEPPDLFLARQPVVVEAQRGKQRIRAVVVRL